MPNGIPFELTEFEAIAIIDIGILFAQMVMFFFLIVLMIYYSKRIKQYLTIIVIYLFSIIMIFLSFNNSHTLFTPYFEIFFMLFQTSLFIQVAIEYYTIEKRKKGLL